MVKFGIVGAGAIAHVFAQDMKHVSNAKLVGVASRSLKKAEAFQKEYDIPHAFEGYEAMAKSDEIDAVYIATPHSFHKEQSILFMTHNKHVLCEKPITVNVQELKDMISVAKMHNVALMEAMWTRFLPSTKAVLEYVNTEDVGMLKEATLEFGYALIDDYDPQKRLLNPKLAGGGLLDIGVYPVHFINNFININNYQWDATATKTETGVDATCEMTTIDDSNTPRIKLVSSIEQTLSQKGVLIFENATIEMEDFSRCKKYTINGKSYEVTFENNGFVHQIEAFSKTIEDGELENALLPLKTSLGTMRFMDNIRKKINLIYPFESHS